MGSGALTLALLRAVGPEGKVISYEQREDFARRALANIHLRMGEVTNLAVRLRPVEEGLGEEEPVDRAVFDLPEPWRLVEPVRACCARAGSSSPTSPPSSSRTSCRRRCAAIPATRWSRPSRRCSGRGTSTAPRCARSTGWSRNRLHHGGPARGARGRPLPASHRDAGGASEMLERHFGLAAQGTTVGRRGARRRHDLHGDGLHHLREPGHPVLRGRPRARGQGRALRRHPGCDLPGRGRDDHPHGARDELPPRGGLRHGAQRRRRLPAHRRPQAALAGGHGRDLPRGPRHHRLGAHGVP